MFYRFLTSVAGKVKMKEIIGQVTKVQTTKDQCIRLTIDVEKSFAGNTNLLTWQDTMVVVRDVAEIPAGVEYNITMIVNGKKS